jgi:hypothetical protein
MFRTCKCRVPIPVFKDSDTDSSSFLLASLRNPNCGPISSLGIALITTVSERRQQFHQTNVGSAIATSSQQFAVRTQALAD